MQQPTGAALDDAHVQVNIVSWTDLGGNTAPTTDDHDGNCVGTATAPTNAPGYVCIYVIHSDNADDFNGFGVNSDQGFKANFTNTPNAGDSFFDAVWFYREP